MNLLVVAASGLGLGLALIVAIGAQNAFVLRQGLRGEHVATVVVVCAVSDLTLIAAGTAGAGALLESRPGLVTGVRLVGAAFLLVYGGLAARRAIRPGTLATEAAAARSWGATAGTALALTWLNPHVYLDTVVLLGSVAAAQGDARWVFAAGAATGSVIWFATLGVGARLLRPLFARPGSWRVLDALVAVVMFLLALGLLRS